MQREFLSLYFIMNILNFVLQVFTRLFIIKVEIGKIQDKSLNQQLK